MEITHGMLCMWLSARSKPQKFRSRNWSFAMHDMHMHALHPVLLSPSAFQSPWQTMVLQFSSVFHWGGKQVPASLSSLQSRKNSRTGELYRSIPETDFPAEGFPVHVPPLLPWACIELWRSVIISECLCLQSLQWRNFFVLWELLTGEQSILSASGKHG